ncbi:F-box-like protein [Gracilaria domingensis]|nr:F-box-like protein [Gracilaria domingensis]
MLQSCSLADLPDDVLLRVVSLTGPLRVQVGTAFRLASVCNRFRRLIYANYLANILHISSDAIYTLSLADANAARTAIDSMFASTVSLRTLNLSGCPPGLVSHCTISSLVQVARHSLVEVNFAHCTLSDDVLRPFMTCPKLRRLILPSCGITGSMFRHSQRVAPIEELNLSWVHSLTQEGVEAVASIPTLKRLCLKGCDSVDNETLQAFFHSEVSKSLEVVSLAFCPISNRCLVSFLRCTPRMKELVLAENRGNIWPQGLYTQAGIDAIRAQFPYVKITFIT